MSEYEQHLEQDISEKLGKNIHEITSFFDLRKKLYHTFSHTQDRQQILAIYKEFLKQGAKVQLMLNGFHEYDKKKYSTRIKNILHGFTDKETLGTSGFNNLYMQGEIIDNYTKDGKEIAIKNILEHGELKQLPEIERYIDEACDLNKDNFLVRRFKEYIQRTTSYDPRIPSYYQKHTTSGARGLFMGIFPFKNQKKKEISQEDPYDFLNEGDELMKKLMELLTGYMIAKNKSHSNEKEEVEESIDKESITSDEEKNEGMESEKKNNFEKAKKFITEKILHRNKETKAEIKDVFETFGKEEMGKMENMIFEGELKSFFKHPNEKKIGEIIKTYSGLNTPKDKILKGLRYLVRKYKVGLSSFLLLTTVLTASPKLRELGEEKIKALRYRFSPTEISVKEQPGKLTSFIDENEALFWLDKYKNISDTSSNIDRSIDIKAFLDKIKDKRFTSLEGLKEQREKSTDTLFQELRKTEGGYMYNNGFIIENITSEDSLRLREVINTVNFDDIGKILNYRTGRENIKYRSDIENFVKTLTDGIQFFPLNNEDIQGVSIDYSEENRKILINTKIALEQAQHTLIHELGHKVSKDNPYMFVTEGGNEYKVIRDCWKLLGKDYFGSSYTDGVIDYLLLSHNYATEDRHDMSSIREKGYNDSEGTTRVGFDQSQTMDSLLTEYQGFLKSGATEKAKQYEGIIKYRKLSEILNTHKTNEFDPLFIMYFLNKDFPSELTQQQESEHINISDKELGQDSFPGYQQIFAHRGLTEEDFSPHGWEYLSGLRDKYQTSKFAQIEKLPLDQQMKQIDSLYTNFLGRNIQQEIQSNINTPSSGISNDGILSKLRNHLFGDNKGNDSESSFKSDIMGTIFRINFILSLYLYFMTILKWVRDKRKIRKHYESKEIHNLMYEEIEEKRLLNIRINMFIKISIFSFLNSITYSTELSFGSAVSLWFLLSMVASLRVSTGLAVLRKSKDMIQKGRYIKNAKKHPHDLIQDNIALLEYNKKLLYNYNLISGKTNFDPNGLYLFPITDKKLKNMDEVFSRKATKQKKERPQKIHKRLRQGTDTNMIIINAEDHQGQRINRYKTAGLPEGKLCIINETKKMELKNEIANNGQILVGMDLNFEQWYPSGLKKEGTIRKLERNLNTLYNFLAQSKVYAHKYHKNIDIVVFRNSKLVDVIHLYGGTSSSNLDIKGTIQKYHTIILNNYIEPLELTEADYLHPEIMEKYLKDKKYDKIISFGVYGFNESISGMLDPDNKRHIETIGPFDPVLDLNQLINGTNILSQLSSNSKQNKNRNMTNSPTEETQSEVV